MMKKYLLEHLSTVYIPEPISQGEILSYQNRFGWIDHYIGEKILISHRENVYSAKQFPEKLHTHDFFEMDIYLGGAVSYIADSREIVPQRDDILIFPPNCQHTAHMGEEGTYNRYVFYFTPDMLAFLGNASLPEIFQCTQAKCLHIPQGNRAAYSYQRERLFDLLQSGQQDTVVEVFACFLQLLSLIAKSASVRNEAVTQIPPKVHQIKQYIDTEFVQIKNISQIAQQLFYSREHISRLFKQYYNTDISEYLVDKKIDYARKLLEKGNSVTFSSTMAGFHNMSSFIQAFRQRVGTTPAKYKQNYRKTK